METARIYVGTYAKYNSGSIAGAWIDLEPFAGDRDGFFAAAAKLHANEADPELMFQDYEGFPSAFYNESSAPEALFEWLDMDDDERELLAVYLDATGYADASLEDAQDRFMGTYNSPEDWAAEWLENSGEIPEHLRNYIDYEAYVRDAQYEGITFHRHNGDVWVFSA
tara:strand:+ start:867 stop:1367 length:501 start_codon:yes stop_codon:yes gene_type:complete